MICYGKIQKKNMIYYSEIQKKTWFVMIKFKIKNNKNDLEQ